MSILKSAIFLQHDQYIIRQIQEQTKAYRKSSNKTTY